MDVRRRDRSGTACAPEDMDIYDMLNQAGPEAGRALLEAEDYPRFLCLRARLSEMIFMELIQSGRNSSPEIRALRRRIEALGLELIARLSSGEGGAP